MTAACSRCWPILLVLVLAGCAGNPPKQVGGPIVDQPSVSAVQVASADFVGRTVRWGGEILGVSNAAGHTDIEVYGRPLYDDAEPQLEGGDGVRFIARIAGFVDPVEYSAGKRLTVRGRLLPAISREIGEYAYRYPLVAVEGSHLWPAYQPPPEPPWYRDPYWDPWWPYGPWGPYRHPYWW